MTAAVVIRLRNLSNDAHAPHIRDFFKGLSIPEGGVQIIGGDDGTAFIIFGSDEDARKAMMQDNKYLCGSPVKLTLSSQTEMNKIIEDSQNENTTSGQTSSDESTNQPDLTPTKAPITKPTTTFNEDLPIEKNGGQFKQQEEASNCVEMTFPCGRVSESDCYVFFAPLNIQFAKVHPSIDGIYQTAVVKFSNIYEKREALKKDGSMLRNIPIAVSAGSERMLDVVAPHNQTSIAAAPFRNQFEVFNQHPPAPVSWRMREPIINPMPPRDLCIEIFNLPTIATYDLVGNFFELPRYLKQEKLFLEMGDSGCKGCAYIDFGGDIIEFERALLKDRTVFTKNVLSVQPISLPNMVEVFRLNKEFYFNQIDYERKEKEKISRLAGSSHKNESYPAGRKDFTSGSSRKHKVINKYKSESKQVDKTQPEQSVVAKVSNENTNDVNVDANKVDIKVDALTKNDELAKENDDKVDKVSESLEDTVSQTETEAKVDQISLPSTAKSDEDNQKVETKSSPEVDPKTEEPKAEVQKTQQNRRKFCVRLANVPYHASEEDIRNFFKGISIPPNGITILSKGIKKSGHVFVRFNCAEDAHEAEKHHEENFMGRSVLVKTSYVQYLKTIWERVIGPGFPEDKFNEEAHISNTPARPQRSIIDVFYERVKQYKMTCLHIRNLPSSTEEADVYGMLKKEMIGVRRIDVIKDPIYRCCKGEAFVQLYEVEDCYRAVALHEKLLFRGHPVQFFPITLLELKKDLESMLPPPRADTLYRDQAHVYPVRTDVKSVDYPKENSASVYAPGPYGYYGKRPRVDPAYPHLDYQVEPRTNPIEPYPGVAVAADRFRSSTSPSESTISATSRAEAAFVSRSPSSEYARKYAYPYAAVTDYRQSSESLPKHVSSTIKMLNLSYNVTQEDIMEFFMHYNPIPKSVRLVYDGQGCLTGEGLITFLTPEAAQAAVEHLDGQTFLQRKIKLELDQTC